MKQSLVSALSVLALAASSLASSISPHTPKRPILEPRQSSSARSSCSHSATSRGCWGDYSIDTNWYTEFPSTGRKVEYWLEVSEIQCAPDGYNRTCQTFNGTVPGPAIMADWGDELVVHVTNRLSNNGTSIHWHGLRQLNSVAQDGVPGVTECPTVPGNTTSYHFNLTQFGSTWYHSHLSLQYAEGLYGPLIIRGPSTANYDEDLGALFLQDWSHTEAFTLWHKAKLGAPPALDTGLINGTNVSDRGGRKFEMVLEAGKKYLLRLINVAIDGKFQFSIDGHRLTVIANDLVPIVPFETDSVEITIGQRYDVILEANAAVGDYWLRAGWVGACSANMAAENMTGIVRYDGSSTLNPSTESSVTKVKTCGDMEASHLVPHLNLNVSDVWTVIQQELSFNATSGPYFMWTINTSSLVLDWERPTLLRLVDGETIFPTPYNVVKLEGAANQWIVLVIQDRSGLGVSHPIHLHGHDFWVLEQAAGIYNGSSAGFDMANPPRRDVATLPGNGYLAIAFQLDNPGAWLVHCHIAWHASSGLSLEFVENASRIRLDEKDTLTLRETCAAWKHYEAAMPFEQDDSGI